MTINKKSTLVKYLTWYYDLGNQIDYPRSLCSFFWVMLLAFTGIIFSWPTALFKPKTEMENSFLVFLRIIGGCYIVVPILIILVTISTPQMMLVSAAIFKIVIQTPLVFYLFTTGIFLLILIKRLVVLIKSKFEPKVKKAYVFKEEPSALDIISEYLKAKKRKVCPLITYKEE